MAGQHNESINKIRHTQGCSKPLGGGHLRVTRVSMLIDGSAQDGGYGLAVRSGFLPILCCLPLYLRDSSGTNLRGLLGGLDEITYFEPLAQYLAHKILGQIITEH